MRLERGRAFIIDNRHATVERVNAHARDCFTADAEAFHLAQQECAERNDREGWIRFLPMLDKTARALGLLPKCIRMHPLEIA